MYNILADYCFLTCNRASKKTFNSRKAAMAILIRMPKAGSSRQVGAQLGVSHSVIGRFLERYEQTNSAQQRPKSGRK